MVDRDLMARMALSRDTQVSRAFLRALGIEAPPRRPSASSVPDRYGGMDECFRNLGSPMDGRA